MEQMLVYPELKYLETETWLVTANMASPRANYAWQIWWPFMTGYKVSGQGKSKWCHLPGLMQALHTVLYNILVSKMERHRFHELTAWCIRNWLGGRIQGADVWKSPGQSKQLSQTSVLRNRDRDAWIKQTPKSGIVPWEFSHFDEGLGQTSEILWRQSAGLWSPPLSLWKARNLNTCARQWLALQRGVVRPQRSPTPTNLFRGSWSFED